MNYATVQDMIDRFSERELIQLTDPDIAIVREPKAQRALDDAQSLADGSLARVYRLPLTGCTMPAPVPGNPAAVQLVPPPQLTRIVCDLARYYLYEGLAPDHEVAIRYKAAVAELQAIADGKAVLTCPWGGLPGALVAGDVPGEGEVLYEFSPRSVRDEDLRGYA